MWEAESRVLDTLSGWNYINGQFVRGQGEECPVRDPATEEVLATVPWLTIADADRAIQAARTAFDQSEWPALSHRERAAILHRIADVIQEDRDTLAWLETRNTGKTLAESRVDIDDVVACFRYYAALIAVDDGTLNLMADDSVSLTIREPIGVAALITPWNYPLLQASWKIAPALAMGNTVIVKPAQLTPLTTLRLAQLIDEYVDLPPGVFNVVCGRGSEIGALLARSSDVDMVSLTGGQEAGKQVMALASHNFKRVALELGGKNVNVILDDANLELAVDYALNAGFFHAGQVCSAGARIMVQRPMYRQFLDVLIERAAKIRVGNGLQQDTEMGPVISLSHRDAVHQAVQHSQQDGARLLLGGAVLDQGAFRRGYWYSPTIVETPGAPTFLNTTEVFGPVVSVEPFDGESEVVRRVNSMPFGLAGAVWTQDLARGLRLARSMRVGTFWINDFNRYFPEAPWGGMKTSGLGRELSRDGLWEYSESKHVFANLNPQPLKWFSRNSGR